MKQPEINFLQSPAWARFQGALGREVIQKDDGDLRYLAIEEHGRLGSRLYCPAGPMVENKAALRTILKELTEEAKHRKLDFIRIEPRGGITEKDLEKLGLRRSHHDVQPADTVISDVSGSEEEIRAALSQTARRYARKADNAGVTYSLSHGPVDIHYFIELIHDVAQRTGMKPMSDQYFLTIADSLFPTRDGGLLFAELDGKKIAAVIFYTDGTTMCYAHAANHHEYRNISPAYGLGLYALLFAHEQGCKYFDWYGVAPEGAPDNHRWAGFTQFKLSFGGQRVSYSGTWELPVNKMRYRLYKTALKVGRKS